MPQSPIADPLAWRAVTAPSLVDLEILANKVYRGLPKKFRNLVRGPGLLDRE
jgi:predicted Zn-dependent protease with MMP-like domain